MTNQHTAKHRYGRRERVDYVGAIEIVDKAAGKLPTPGYAPATRTREGYLEVDALIARDGLLEYSDGEKKWIEYRPRTELERAASTWSIAPATDNHPTKMVDSTTWATVARGIAIGSPTVELHDGVAYLRGRLRFTDATLIKKIEDGQRELSIGFTSEVLQTQGGVHTDGTRCDAVQTELIGNHIASVPRGRAGPACRVLLDSAAWSVHDMTTKKNDNMGAPTDLVGYPAPDGTKVMLPTWVVAALGAQTPAVPGGDNPGAPAPLPAAPVAPVAAAAPVQIPAAAPVVKDSLASMRRRLDRLAAAAGVPEDVLDADDSVAIARAYLNKAMPHAKDRIDKMDAAGLAVLVETAKPPEPERGPWGGRGDAKPPGQRNDAAEDPEVVEFMKSQGYA